jgi:uncharacterized phage protein (TIGR02218 family)
MTEKRVSVRLAVIGGEKVRTALEGVGEAGKRGLGRLGGFETGWFRFGTIEWTAGANAGRRAEVLAHDLVDGLAILTLLEAPVRAVTEGDAFTIRAGCDKRIETCSAKFGNVADFRGFPHIPGQDTILRYASRDGGHEGGVL